MRSKIKKGREWERKEEMRKIFIRLSDTYTRLRKKSFSSAASDPGKVSRT
jgi:hypothetical protein